jgi:hypothetical protein
MYERMQSASVATRHVPVDDGDAQRQRVRAADELGSTAKSQRRPS